MNITRLSRSVEIAFWVSVIDLLQTQPLAITLVQNLYDLQYRLRQLSFRILLVLCIVSGLSLGFLLGFLTYSGIQP